MLAMQYSIPLPPNYSAEQVHARVAERSRLFDGLEGMVHKSFLYNDADKLYAPFYVWKDVIEAQKFLMDDLFHGVIQAFSRQRVRSWYVINMVYGNTATNPTFARREIDAVAAEEKLDSYLLDEKKHQAELLADPNLYMHLVALDADRWEILRMSLWADEASAPKPTCDVFQHYEVLHMCCQNRKNCD